MITIGNTKSYYYGFRMSQVAGGQVETVSNFDLKTNPFIYKVEKVDKVDDYIVLRISPIY